MDPFLGEIRLVGFNFAPQGWALCNGAQLAIQQNVALFALLGNRYGGDGTTNFKLPDLRGRVPVHRSNSSTPLGQAGGAESVALTSAGMPAHNHAYNVSSAAGLRQAGTAAVSVLANPGKNLYVNASALTPMGAATCGSAGGGAAHQNMQPSLALNYVIATSGLFPPRD